MKRLITFLALLLIPLSFAHGQPIGGGTTLPVCTNGQVVVYNTTTSMWDTCSNLSGGGDMLEAVWATASKIKPATGGTGLDSSALTGTPYITAGTWAAANASTMRTNLGLAIGTNVLAPNGDGSALTGLTAAQLPDAAANGTTKGVATFTAADFNASSGVISIDYTNGQAAATGTKGFLTGTDWDTFNAKAAANQTMYIGTTGVAINRGTGALTLAGLTLTTPVLGVATATSINKMAITAPATASTLAVADGKTFTVSNTLTLAGTDSSVITFPAASGTVAYAGTMTNGKICVSNADGKTVDCNTETPTGLGTITAVGDITTGAAFTVAIPGKTLIWNNATSGAITLQAQTGALGASVVSLPVGTGTLAFSDASNLAVGSDARGDILIRGASVYGRLAKGSSGAVLTMNANDPLWTDFFLSGTTAQTYTFPSTSKTIAASDGSNLAFGSDARGDIAYRGVSAYGRLAKGTAGAVLTIGANDPAWTSFLFSGTAAATYTFPGSTKTIAASDASNLAVGSDARGDILIRGASAYGRLGIGNTGSFLTNNGTDPAWSTFFLSGTAAQTYTLPSATATLQSTTGTPAGFIIASQAQGDLLYASSATAWSRLGQSTQYKFLITNGASANPSWSAYTMPASIATGGVMYGSGTNAVSQLAAGSAGQMLRMGASIPAWSTHTTPDTIAAGSVYAANAANTLSAITSTSGTKFLQNIDGTISWATGVGTMGGTTGAVDNAILRADGTGGVTIQSSSVTIDDTGLLTAATLSSGAGGFTVDADGDTVAKSVTITKASGVAGDIGLYEANSTDTDAAGFRGPASLSANTSYRGQFPNARPTSDNSVLAWGGTAGSGSGTPADPYIHAMSYIIPLQLSGGTMTGKLIGLTPAGGATVAPLNLPHGTPGSLSNGDIWTDTGGLYARINGGTVGPYISSGSLIDDTAYNATSWDGVTGVGPSKNAVRDYFELLAPSGIVKPAAGGTGIANNAASTLTISGNYATTLTVTGATGVTLPTSGTLGTVTAPIALASQASGDTFYATSGTAIARLAKGTAYQIYQMNSGATAPEWTSTLSLSAMNLGSATSSIPWPVGTTAAQTADGSTYWNSTTDALSIGDGATRITLDMTAAATYTFPAASASLAPLTSPSFTTPDIGAATGTSLTVTGVIAGLLPLGSDITTGSNNITAAQTRGYLHRFTGAATAVLPTASSAGFGAAVCFKVRDAAEEAIVDLQGAEVLNLGGTPQAAGVGIKATGAGEYVCLVATTDADGSGTDGWETMGKTSGWVSQ